MLDAISSVMLAITELVYFVWQRKPHHDIITVKNNNSNNNNSSNNNRRASETLSGV